MAATKEDIQKAMLRKAMGKELPEGQFQISPEDKPKIRALGKELAAFLFGYAQAHGNELHAKIVAGAFDYVTELCMQRKKILADHYGDDMLTAIDELEKEGLSDLLSEPYQDLPAPTPNGLTAALAAPGGLLTAAPMNQAQNTTTNAAAEIPTTKEPQ